jgi:hypothetical protein
MSGSAIISDCGLYRYRLSRDLGQIGPTVMFIMVNPSTADADRDDATIRKCIGFAKRYGGGELLVGNKFAFRATDVKALRRARDPVGPENDRHLREMMLEADIIFAAWGSLNKLPESLQARWRDVVRMTDELRPEAGRCELWTLGYCDDGHPRHPLMASYDSTAAQWKAPWFPNRRPAADTPRDSGSEG